MAPAVACSSGGRAEAILLIVAEGQHSTNASGCNIPNLSNRLYVIITHHQHIAGDSTHVKCTNGNTTTRKPSPVRHSAIRIVGDITLR